MTSVAFLGTGTMGLPMARNLAQNGFAIRAWNRSPERASPLREHGVEVFEDPREAAEGAEIVVTMLSDAEAVLETASRALASLADGRLWIQMSTIGIDGIERCQELAAQTGSTLVDAPVLGTREPAEKGALVVLASGPEDGRERCDPLFGAVGARTLWLGPAGTGTRLKVVVNSWIVGVVGVLAETLSLAEALELDPEQFFRAVEGGPLDLPYAQLKGRAMIERRFDDPSFRLALARKDAELVLDASSRNGLELPVMEAVLTRLRRAEDRGLADMDMSATYLANSPSGSAGP